jgi:hypothetical protein
MSVADDALGLIDRDQLVQLARSPMVVSPITP